MSGSDKGWKIDFTKVEGDRNTLLSAVVQMRLSPEEQKRLVAQVNDHFDKKEAQRARPQEG